MGALAFGAMAVAARIIADPFGTTAFAHFYMAT